ncbi:alpha-amylase family glycosyl hydrolase [Companilactobacillus zhachilii]|uniref:alpha-amylase family glycosyl hydrolase n=1 Tax=Companilactobacillus zhachilii TaxID=2304606 RepID=UPI004034128E
MEINCLKNEVMDYLSQIYDGDDLKKAKSIFQNIINNNDKSEFQTREKLTSKNVYLITYGDAVYRKDEAPLVTLRRTIGCTSPFITDVHILPMFPYTSDDGFSVTNYNEINPELGTWQDVREFGNERRLMFDFVANHSSKSGSWFNKFLNLEKNFENAFLKKSEISDTTKVIRPRVGPLFHSYKKSSGKEVSIWTTFSEDQVDNNVRDPYTLGRLTQVLLNYSKNGASSIRLDAIGFLWKESGTTCMHLPQTHSIVRMWKSIINCYAPNTQIITETNVPQKENISYLGNGENEATQVYQFPLPPLVLYSFVQQDASVLTKWASEIHSMGEKATFFNFLASHDGIGMRPTEGLLSESQRENLVSHVLDCGGKVSYKINSDGSKSVYELNINYGDALGNTSDSESTQTKKIIAAHNILLSFIGVPAIYYHSLFGSHGDFEAVNKTKDNRQINREKLNADDLIIELKDNKYRRTIHQGLSKLIQIRGQHSEFNPYGQQEVKNYNKSIFAFERYNKGLKSRILCITNISENRVSVDLPFTGKDIIRNVEIKNKIKIEPYEFYWILH